MPFFCGIFVHKRVKSITVVGSSWAGSKRNVIKYVYKQISNTLITWETAHKSKCENWTYCLAKSYPKLDASLSLLQTKWIMSCCRHVSLNRKNGWQPALTRMIKGTKGVKRIRSCASFGDSNAEKICTFWIWTNLCLKIRKFISFLTYTLDLVE